jgi:hypothetical protein
MGFAKNDRLAASTSRSPRVCTTGKHHYSRAQVIAGIEKSKEVQTFGGGQ